MIPNEPTLYKNFISDQERINLKDYAMELFANGELRKNNQGDNRFFKNFKEEHLLSTHHKILYDRIVKTLQIETPTIDPLLGLIISVMTPGAFIHLHRDQYMTKFKHISHKRNVRFNVMVERGIDVCYDPHIEQKPFKVDKCDAWCFSATKFIHSTPVITGPENRIVYQFGFCLDAI